MSLFFLRRGRGLSPFLTILLGTLAYRSLSRGNGKLAALIGGLGTSGRLGALLSTILQQVLDGAQQPGQGRPAGPAARNYRGARDIEETLGEERIRWLMTETGMTRDELIEGLRRFS
jgi:hypothetical protein